MTSNTNNRSILACFSYYYKSINCCKY